jgi:hypothetical protein
MALPLPDDLCGRLQGRGHGGLRKQSVDSPSCAFASTPKRSTRRRDRRSRAASDTHPPFLPLLGFVRVSPSVVSPGAQVLPACCHAFVDPVPTDSHGPLSWLLPPQRLLSHSGFGCIATRSDHGVRRVSARRDPIDRQCRMNLASTGFPDDAVHTPRSIPLAGSRTASLRPLPS